MLAAMDERLERIESARVKANISIRHLARAVDMTDTGLRSVLSGQTKNPRDPKLYDRLEQAIAEELKRRGAEFTFVDDPGLINAMATNVRVRSYRGALAAGSLQEEPIYEEDDWYEVPAAFLVEGPEAALEHAIIQVTGFSMAPRIESGERILFRQDAMMRTGVISLVRNPEGKRMVKVVRSLGDGRYAIASINKAGASASDLTGWEMLGYAVAIIGPGGTGQKNIEYDEGRPLRA